MARTVIARTAIAGIAAAIFSVGGAGPAGAQAGFAGSTAAPARDGGTSHRSDGAATVSAPPTHPGWVKYYIVPAPAGGVTLTLQQIALLTLGSSSFAAQIFQLNAGRIQPDGGRLVSAGTLTPGWILELPAAAQGPGVMYGPLPVISPEPVSRAKVPGTSAGAGSPASGRATSGPARQRARPAGRPAELIAENGAELVALIVLVFGLGLALTRRRRPARSRQMPALPASGAPALHDSAIAARELTTVGGGGGPAWLAEAPDSSAGNDAMLPGYLVAQDALPARAQAVARNAPAPARPRGNGVPGRDHDQDPGQPGRRRRTGLPGGRHRRHPDHPVPPGDAGPASGAAGPRPTFSPRERETLAPPLEPLPPLEPAEGPGHADDIPRYPAWLGSPEATAADLQQPADGGAPRAQPASHADAPAVPAARDDDLPRRNSRKQADRLAANSGQQLADSPADAPADAEAGDRVPDRGEPGAGRSPGSAEGDEAQSQATPPDKRKRRPERTLTPAALHLLGASLRKGKDSGSDGRVQRHQVMLGDDKVEVVLAQAPAPGRNGKPRSGNAWLATSPYLVWAPLPYETPDGGKAFACLGTGDEGCLFIDLAAAPGFITITGDSDSAARLAESLAHQLCRRAAEDESCMVVIVDDVVPEPRPLGAVVAPTLRDLGLLGPDVPVPETEVVFCTVRASEDALVLARYVGRSAHRVVPVVLGDLPDAPWSLHASAWPARSG
jgi:hypothetical protein